MPKPKRIAVSPEALAVTQFDAPLGAPPPDAPMWAQRPDEPPEAYARFLWYTFTRPPMSALNVECINDAATYDWDRRATIVRYRLTLDPEPYEVACQRMSQDALIWMRRELEYKAALAVATPGTARMGEITDMMRLSVELSFAQRSNAQAQEWDMSALTPEERVQFAEMLARVMPAHPQG